jgi:hypothetical protein
MMALRFVSDEPSLHPKSAARRRVCVEGVANLRARAYFGIIIIPLIYH